MTEPQSIVSLIDVLANSVKRYGSLELFGTKTGNEWRYITYAEFGKLADDMRGGLATLGVGRGDRSRTVDPSVFITAVESGEHTVDVQKNP